MRVMYLSGGINKQTSEHAPAWVGWMVSPNMGNRIPNDGRKVGLDNGCFGDKFSPRAWRRFLLKHYPIRDRVMFVVVPDVVGDSVATLERWRRYAPTARLYGMPLAFVAQDGATHETVPWDECDCLFIGGTDSWKWPDRQFSPALLDLIAAAKARGKWIHAGRVNSASRFAMCEAAGVDSGDGTFLTRGPEVNLRRLVSWRQR